ncbi:hypothetical protein BDZ94DRAFT_1260117 [Collybia nuda]|uniref:Uncharacterized protein n=1 Tax=Collybia nuda TaxID=64659 RepID=A0A9P5Y724_9AGAR|nr:hypothetical protein BDZ94DRAFT_1260117 [Collybia nuda]
MSISEDIRFQKHEIQTRSSQVTAAYDRIETTIARICEIHTHLQKSLSDALIRFPSNANKKYLSLNDLLATTIETSLIKLSLMRARAHQALYDFKSPTNPQASMSGAVSFAYATLKKEERRLDEEIRALNRQTEEYEVMLKLVDGEGGGFGQVVEDWTRVQKEKEECKRDLRRLGWTGD